MSLDYSGLGKKLETKEITIAVIRNGRWVFPSSGVPDKRILLPFLVSGSGWMVTHRKFPSSLPQTRFFYR